MHLNDYSVGDEVELTKDVCENTKGQRGVVYESKELGCNVIRFAKGSKLITGHIKLIKSNQSKIDHDLLIYGESFEVNGKHVPVDSVRVYTKTV